MSFVPLMEREDFQSETPIVQQTCLFFLSCSKHQLSVIIYLALKTIKIILQNVVWCTHAYSSSYGDEVIGLYELRNLRPPLQDPISKEKIKKEMKKKRKEKRGGRKGEREGKERKEARCYTMCITGNTAVHV